MIDSAGHEDSGAFDVDAVDAPAPLYFATDGQPRVYPPTYRLDPNHALVPADQGIVLSGNYALQVQKFRRNFARTLGGSAEA